jgi:hypothetical protein
MLHGLMDEDSFGKLDQTGLIDPILKEMYSKIQDLNKKLTDLESMTDGNGEKEIAIDDLIDEATSLARAMFKKQGKSQEESDSKFNPEQLRAGQNVEMEHTGDPVIAKEIAKDHLSEHENYYDALRLMERALKGGHDAPV